MLPKPKCFHINERILDAVTLKIGEGNERGWIANMLLFMAQIEMTRLEGVRREPDRFGI